MLSIKFKRIGRKKKPFYNIIVSEKLSYIKGNYIEKLGYFNPISKEKKINVNRIEYWISKGAVISVRLKNLLTN